jgi:hypothetical protein
MQYVLKMRLATAQSVEVSIFSDTPAHLCLPVDPGVHLGEGLVEGGQLVVELVDVGQRRVNVLQHL